MNWSLAQVLEEDLEGAGLGGRESWLCSLCSGWSPQASSLPPSPHARPWGQPLLLAPCESGEPQISFPSGCPQDSTASWPVCPSFFCLELLPSTSDSVNAVFSVSIRTSALGHMINCFREASPSPCFLEQEGCLLHQPSLVGRVRGVCMGGEDCPGKNGAFSCHGNCC